MATTWRHHQQEACPDGKVANRKSVQPACCARRDTFSRHSHSALSHAVYIVHNTLKEITRRRFPTFKRTPRSTLAHPHGGWRLSATTYSSVNSLEPFTHMAPSVSLASAFPALAAEWHPSHNGDLLPSQVASSSHHKVWWRCPQGHSYDMAVGKRTARGQGCPFCAGQRVSPENNLKARFPLVAAEWHPSKNGDLLPSQVTTQTKQIVWWQCPRGHSYDMAVGKRTSRGQGCPFCAGKRVSPENNLAARFPLVAAEWHPSKNGPLSPDLVTSGSKLKVWWLCSQCKRQWRACVHKRTRASKPTGCPRCGEKKRAASYSAPAPGEALSDLFPHIASEWDSRRNGALTPHDVRVSSNHRVHWICSRCGKRWVAMVATRTKGSSGKPPEPRCRSCSIQIALAEHYTPGAGESLADRYPRLALEWHPTKNGDLKPNHLLPNSNREVWWQCAKGHEWLTAPNARARGNGCRRCSNQTSEAEIRILTEIQHLFSNVESRANVHGREIDIYLADARVGIEYDGSHWHKSKTTQDKEKNEFLQSKGVTLIRLRDAGLSLLGPHDVIAEKTALVSKADMNRLVTQLISLGTLGDCSHLTQYLRLPAFANEAGFIQYVSYLPDPFPEHSLAAYPDLCTEFDLEKNSPLSPTNLIRSSDVNAWWKCSRCGKGWQQPIVSRTRSQRLGCLDCHRKKLSRRYSQPKDGQALAIRFPDIAAEWHPTLNEDLTPADVAAFSGKKVWWQCSRVQSHVWDAVISNRTRQQQGCPMCSGKRTTSETSLRAEFPAIAAEWHPDRNGRLTSDDVRPGSGKSVWWVCSRCDHEWERPVYARTHGSKCPECTKATR